LETELHEAQTVADKLRAEAQVAQRKLKELVAALVEQHTAATKKARVTGLEANLQHAHESAEQARAESLSAVRRHEATQRTDKARVAELEAKLCDALEKLQQSRSDVQSRSASATKPP
jgi:hypothetical protein